MCFCRTGVCVSVSDMSSSRVTLVVCVCVCWKKKENTYSDEFRRGLRHLDFTGDWGKSSSIDCALEGDLFRRGIFVWQLPMKIRRHFFRLVVAIKVWKFCLKICVLASTIQIRKFLKCLGRIPRILGLSTFYGFPYMWAFSKFCNGFPEFRMSRWQVPL